ncbi:19994_t:CDS:2, partial [Racocetra fulgida]
LARPYQYEDFYKDPESSVNNHHPKIHEQLNLPYWVKVVLTVILVLLGELKELINYHGSSTKHGGDLVTDSVTIIRGALDLQDKAVEIAMTPIDKVYMLPIDTIMDRITMREIYSTGHSRIPIFGGSRQNIIGVLLTKSLIMYSPDDARSLKTFPINTIPTVSAETPLFDILNTFQDGRSHMAIVIKENNPIGIITLEDVLEELIQEEIYDESDTRIGLAVKLETGDQLILASKKRRGESSKQQVYHKNKFKSPTSRADSGQEAPSHFEGESNRVGDLMVFDEPSTMSTVGSHDGTGKSSYIYDLLDTNIN